MKNNWWRCFLFVCLFSRAPMKILWFLRNHTHVLTSYKVSKSENKILLFHNQKRCVDVGCEVHLIYLPWNFLKVWVKNHIDAPKSVLAQFVLRVTLRPTQWWEGPRCIQETQVGVPWFCPTSRTSLDPTPTPTQGYRIHTPPMQKGFKE